MNIFKFFQRPRGTGALIDDRPNEAKEKDYLFKEIVATANSVVWVEKPQSLWRKFPIFNQNNSGSCVAQTLAKLLGVLYWLKNNVYVHFSATHIYQRRTNKPYSGMVGVEALDIARQGVTLEELVPSQNLTDEKMDNAVIEDYKKEVGKIFKINNYLVLPTNDIETVASVIQTTKKGVMVWFYFTREEWTNHPVIKNPTLDIFDNETLRHSVTAVDAVLVDGKESLIIEDSWGTSFGLAGQRVIDKDFFEARNFFAAYPMNFAFEEQTTEKPKYTFNMTLSFGQTNEHIKSLQDILKYEGMFPINTDSTGYYGSITSKGVLLFQKKYKVASDLELDQLQGKSVGPKTIIKLNELYS